MKQINKKSNSTNAIAQKSRSRRNDEFFTQEQDIINELQQYKTQLINKRIICPCDWDVLDDGIFSLEIIFNDSKKPLYYINSVKKINYNRDTRIFSIWNTQDICNSKEIDETSVINLINKQNKCSFLKALLDLHDTLQFRSICISGFNPCSNKGIRYQDIEYDNYDVCITNPPFTRYKDFIKIMLMEHNRRNGEFNFIAIAPFMNRANPNVGQPLMTHDIYLGYNRQNHLFFNIPNSNKLHEMSCDWITTYADAQNELDKQIMHTGVYFTNNESAYPVCENMTMKDGTHPIKINDVTCIPDDYYGWMFSSISVLDTLSNNEFEWYVTQCQSYFNKYHPENNPFAHKISNDMYKTVDGPGFGGIIFKRRKK